MESSNKLTVQHLRELGRMVPFCMVLKSLLKVRYTTDNSIIERDMAWAKYLPMANQLKKEDGSWGNFKKFKGEMRDQMETTLDSQI